jgi:hypothetical protein
VAWLLGEIEVKSFARRSFLRGVAAVLAGSVPAAALAGRGLVEPALAADTLPANPYRPSAPHLIEAQEVIDYLNLPASPVADNPYGEPAVVTWGTPGQPSTWSNQSECSSFVTSVLFRTYPAWATIDSFTTLFALNPGSAGPDARQYHAGFAAGSAHFQPVGQVPNLLPGDLIAIDYVGQTSPTGHVAMVRRVMGPYVAPQSDLNFAGETQYAVEVADCSSTPHGVFGSTNYAAFPDTRIVDASTRNVGVGYGHMMFYADSTGAFTRHRWSVNSGSTMVYTVAQRPIAAVRVV